MPGNNPDAVGKEPHTLSDAEVDELLARPERDRKPVSRGLIFASVTTVIQFVGMFTVLGLFSAASEEGQAGIGYVGLATLMSVGPFLLISAIANIIYCGTKIADDKEGDQMAAGILLAANGFFIIMGLGLFRPF